MQASRPPSNTEPAKPKGLLPAVSAPAIALPKGGGAIRGIGEKLAANPVTGTGTFSIPIATSPARGGFGPQLSLQYDSGAGNGPFGLGWSLSLPSIARKTDKGLPQYDDAVDSDVFTIFGAEDLVAEFKLEPDGTLAHNAEGNPIIDETERDGYLVRRYRPRVEGLFARIERWSRRADGDVHWRSISRDNVLTVYGQDELSRIADPNDTRHIFSWLICETRDDKGNAIIYEYQPEDSRRIDVSQAHELHRGGRDGSGRRANHYLKCVKYGNRATLLDADNRRPDFLAPDVRHGAEWMFEVLFDYGEGHCQALPSDPARPPAEQHEYVRASIAPAIDWPVRADPFSSYRSGFELRTYRLCRRVLMFHHFAAELGVTDCLVRSTDLEFAEGGIASFIESVSQCSYLRQPTDAVPQRYLRSSLPPLAFTYSSAPTAEELARLQIRELTADELINLPHGFDGANHRWIDLDGEGLSGLLTEQAGAWFYKRNLSPLLERAPDAPSATGKFAPQEFVASLPAPAMTLGANQLLDLAGDGQLDLVDFDGPAPGFYERTSDAGWSPHHAFTSLPVLNWQDANLRFVDLTGDGLSDVLVTEDEVLCWYPSLGEEGFDAGRRAAQPQDGDRTGRLVFADATQSLYLADMTGDGLTDLVRVRNGEVCYWPNLGYGRFGTKVTMDDAPWFDEPDLFDQRRVRLADIDGSGLIDIVYLSRHGAAVYYNQAGNRWSAPARLPQFPRMDNVASAQVLDLLGNGTACLVWSSSLPGEAQRPVRYLDLMNGLKPHLLIRSANNLGAETELRYAPSTKFYLADKYAGKPWVTRLPFPVHCVEKITVTDRWRQTRFTTSYSYHHGYFDGHEREFRGFGRVEQVDVETYGQFTSGNAASPYITADHTLYQPPVKTVTWFHTGAAIGRDRVLSQFAHEYFPSWAGALGGFEEKALPEPDLHAADLTAVEWREALRACKAMALRQEVYELDVDALEQGEHRPVKLFSATTHNVLIHRLQPKHGQGHAVFLVTESEAIAYHYELDLKPPTLSPDPRIVHTLTLKTDAYGQPLQAVSVTYPRRGRFEDSTLAADDIDRIRQVQQQLHVAYSESRYTNDVDEPGTYRLRVPCEALTYELTGIAPRGAYFNLDELRGYRLSEVHQTAGLRVEEIAYHQLATGGAQKRAVERSRALFFQENLLDPLPFGTLNALGLPYESYTLALTEALLLAVFAEKLTPELRAMLAHAPTSGYLSGADLAARFGGIPTVGEYWQRAGIAGFASDAARHFFLPERYTDPFGNTTTLEYDAGDLFVRSSSDALGNTTRVTAFDYRVLAPREIEDINGNRSEVQFDAMGLATAMAVKGKGSEADRLAGLDDVLANPDPAARLAFFHTATDFDETQARRWLGDATARHIYHFGEVRRADGAVEWGVHPAAVCGILRERHVSALGPGEASPLQAAFEYSDGLGSVLVKKSQAEPAEDGGPLRWIANGKTVLNNKGKPVKQYEPYFSESGHRFEEPREVGVTLVIYYDAAGRTVRTEAPDGSYARVEFSPWHVTSHDANDTVLEPGNAWYSSRDPLDPTRPLPRDSLTGTIRATPEQRAAWLAAQHAGTPAVTLLDSLGRDVVAIAHNRTPDAGGAIADEKYLTFTKLDAEGKPLWIRDARGNLVMQYVRQAVEPVSNTVEPLASTPAYDIAGNLLFQHSMDAGDRWMLNDAAGKPMLAWDFNERQTDAGAVDEHRLYITEYDALHRPVAQWLTINGGPRLLIERFEYRDARNADGSDNPRIAEDREANLLGQLVRHHDPSGLVETIGRDFKGNVLEARKTLAAAYDAPVIDWSAGSATAGLEPETFAQITRYDALNRMTQQYGWHRVMVASRVAVYEPRYSARGLLAGEDLTIRAVKTPAGHESGERTEAVRLIAYDAKGQKQRLDCGNGTVTRYDYDPLTFRLRQLRTTRPGFTAPFPGFHSALSDPNVLQQLSYVYDPSGNITEITDEAYEPVYFQNQNVEPRSTYVYDALYRLIEATGRENGAAAGAPPQIQTAPHHIGLPVTAPGALRNYTERYRYDAVGNIEAMRHGAGPIGSWTRHYAYAADSNRLLRSWIGDDVASAVPYAHDTHGSMLNLNRAPDTFRLRWDHRDMIQAANLGSGGWAYYQYEAGKERTRKVITDAAVNKRWERIYLGGTEVYHRFASSAVTEEVETHHLFVGGQRVLIVEDILQLGGSGLSAGARFRYQYSNHLTSVCAELDNAAAVISSEEYHPYGTSAYLAGRGETEVNLKRYRFTGKDRDSETGLNYHSARYYLSWLGRWGSCDPGGVSNGLNIYSYCRCDPVGKSDLSGLQDAPRAPELSISPEQEWLNETAAEVRRGGRIELLPISLPRRSENAPRIELIGEPPTPPNYSAAALAVGEASLELLVAGVTIWELAHHGRGALAAGRYGIDRAASAMRRVPSALNFSGRNSLFSRRPPFQIPVVMVGTNSAPLRQSYTTDRGLRVTLMTRGQEPPTDLPPLLPRLGMERGFIGEETGRLRDTGIIVAPKTPYFESRDRENFRVFLWNGRLFSARGRLSPVNTPSSTEGIQVNRAIFVMAPNGAIYMHRSPPAELRHSSFLRGGPVSMAGEIRVNDGQITEINRQSGHYLPGEQIGQVFREYLMQHGVNNPPPILPPYW